MGEGKEEKVGKGKEEQVGEGKGRWVRGRSKTLVFPF